MYGSKYSSVHRFGFIGVTATQSSINRVFPRWARVLGIEPVEFDPVDLPLDASAERYRAEIARIRRDPCHRGALVTTHKVRLLEAGRDLIDELDPYAELLGETSCISKRDGQLVGHAKDPITAGRSIEDFVPRGHFDRTGGHLLCLGAGGAGLAIAVYLLTRTDPPDQPDHVVLVNRSAERLQTCRRVLDELGVGGRVTYEANDDPSRNDALMAQLPAGSLVVNATGLGKDRPGSPITDAGCFPMDGLAWELNYRGELDFLQQARQQASQRNLTAEDGWRYFVHGWSAVVAEAFHLEIDEPTLEQLADEAAAVRR